MNSIDPLHTVLEHATGQRDQALALFRQAEAAAQAARTQADQLESYRSDFRRRWTERLAQVGSVEVLQCHHGFAGRLDQAIAMQTNTARQAEARLQRARDTLLEREQRVAAIGKLIERRLAELAQQAERREQRQLDEAAARMSAARRRHPNAP